MTEEWRRGNKLSPLVPSSDFPPFVFGDRRGREPASRCWLNLVTMDRCCVFQSVAKAIDEMICFTNPACFHT